MEREDGLLDESDNYFVPFTKSKWTFEDLSGKTVNFRWTFRDTVNSGDGKFLVRDCGERGLAIEITVLLPGSNYYQLRDVHHALYQEHIDAIELNPDWDSENPRSPKFHMIA